MTLWEARFSWLGNCACSTAVSSVITKGDGQIFFDSLKNNTYGM